MRYHLTITILGVVLGLLVSYAGFTLSQVREIDQSRNCPQFVAAQGWEATQKMFSNDKEKHKDDHNYKYARLDANNDGTACNSFKP